MSLSRMLSIAIVAVGVATSAAAEQLGEGQCVDRLKVFVFKTDELLSRRVRDREAYYEIIRGYLPDAGCRVDDVVSIVTKSPFAIVHTVGVVTVVLFENEDLTVSFGLERDTGKIHLPDVSWNGPIPY